MDNLIIILIAFVAGVLLSGRRASRDPQIVYIVTESEQSSRGLGCIPLFVVGLVLVVVLMAVGR
jgi:hypothetical protein